MGASDGTVNRYAGGYEDDNVSTPDTSSHTSTTYCIARGKHNALQATASITSMDTSGFTLTWNYRSDTGALYPYIAFSTYGSANIEIGHIDVEVGNGPYTVTGFDGRPNVGLFFSGQGTAGAGDNRIAYGASDENNDSFSISTLARDASTTYGHNTRYDTDIIFDELGESSWTDTYGRKAFDSLEWDGFQHSNPYSFTSSSQVCYVFLGDLVIRPSTLELDSSVVSLTDVVVPTPTNRFCHGVFQLSTSASGTQTVSGIADGSGSFAPNVVLFTWGNVASASDGSNTNSHNLGFGAALSDGTNYATTRYWRDNASSSASAGNIRNDCCIVHLDAYNSVDGRFGINSMSDGQFVLDIDKQSGSAWGVHYIAMLVDQAAILEMEEPLSTGNQAYAHGMAYDPNAIIVAGYDGTWNNDSPGATGRSLVLGIATSSSAQGVISAQDYYSGAAQDFGYGYSGEIIGKIYNSNLNCRAELYSIDSENVTINWTERTSDSSDWFMVCLKVENVKYDVFTTETGTTAEIERTGYGFKPEAALYIGRNAAMSSQNTLNANNQAIIVGMATGPSSRSSVGSFLDGGSTATQVGHAQSIDEVLTLYDSDGNIEYEMDLVSFDDDGQTLIMDDADLVESMVMCLAFASSGATVAADTLEADFTAVGLSVLPGEVGVDLSALSLVSTPDGLVVICGENQDVPVLEAYLAASMPGVKVVVVSPAYKRHYIRPRSRGLLNVPISELEQ
jgi:hypothetical protein